MTRSAGMWSMALASGIALAAVASPAGAQPPAKVPVVAVVGCLSQAGPDWRLTTATDPVPSIANGPSPGEAIKGPTTGKNEYRLIGVSEFDLPAHKGHTVLVKGLLVKAEPASRVNVTSVTMVSNACAAAAK